MEVFWQIKVNLWKINGKIAVKIPIIFHASFGDKKAGEIWEDFWKFYGRFTEILPLELGGERRENAGLRGGEIGWFLEGL